MSPTGFRSEFENARKPHDPDPYWKPQTVSAVEAKQQVRNKQKPYPSLTVPDIIQDNIQPDDNLQAQQVDPSLVKTRQYAKEGRVSRDGKVKWIEKKGLLYREYEAPEKEGGSLIHSLCTIQVSSC